MINATSRPGAEPAIDIASVDATKHSGPLGSGRSASTAAAADTFANVLGSRLPYTPRPLTRKELKRKDVYAYLSPKLDREFWVTGALGFAAALKHEFDTDVVAFVERPRTLQVSDGHTIEVEYWTRHAGGEEHLWLVVPTLDSRAAPGGKRRYRDEEHARAAADRLQVSLRFMFESELVCLGVAVGTWLQLLPYVQTAHAMDNFAAIEARVHEHFRFISAATFVDIEAALSSFNSHDVRSTVCRAIHEGWLAIDPSRPLHVRTLVRKETGHEYA